MPLGPGDDDSLEQDMTANTAAPSTLPDPEWLRLFAAAAPAEDVVEAWLRSLGDKGREEAVADPPTARTTLRRAIVDARDGSSAVRADAATGWKYTGSIIRATDAALGVAPLQPSKLFGPKGVDLHAPVQVVAADGAAGTLGLYWSGVEGANRVDLLHAQGVTHRLNVAAECEKALAQASSDLVTATVAMEDLAVEQLEDVVAAQAAWLEQLHEAIAQMRSWRDAAAAAGVAASVNVNCQMGKNRSGTVVAAWLCLEHGWELLAAVEHLRTLSSLALGNPHLNVTLAEVVGTPGVDVPLNPANDGGSWVTFSPPGSPQMAGARSPTEGEAGDGSAEAAPEAAALAAARKLEALQQQQQQQQQGDGEGDVEEDKEGENDGLADLAELLGEM